MKWLMLPLTLCLLSVACAKSMSVIAADVRYHTIEDHVEALGTTKSFETAIITADVTEKIVGIHFNDGQAVKKNELLVSLDAREEIARAKTALAELGEAERGYERSTQLYQKRAISKSEWQDSEAAVLKAQGNYDAIRAQLSKLKIIAPFDGVLGLRELSIGALVRPGDKITTIDDISKIRVDFDVPSRYLSKIQPKQTIIGHVSTYANQNFNGQVDALDTQVDPVTRSLRIRAIFPNNKNLLRPGLLMVVDVIVERRQALMIPEEALIKFGDKNFVLKIEKQNQQSIAKKVEISIGYRKPGLIEVTNGLVAGDVIVAHGVNKVIDGQAVTIGAKIEDRH